VDVFHPGSTFWTRSFSTPTVLQAALVTYFLRKPLVVTLRGSELRHRQFRLRRFWVRCSICRAARAIAVSENLKEIRP